jgi:hypothetical protein
MQGIKNSLWKSEKKCYLRAAKSEKEKKLIFGRY